MTTIAVKREGDKIVLAGDTRLTGSATIVTENFVKITKINENFGFGGAGVGKIIKLFQMFSALKMNKAPITELGLLNYYNKFLDFVYEYGDEEAKKCEEAHFIIILKTRMYVIGSGDFYEILDDYYAIGSGDQIALGALAHGASAYQAVSITSKIDLATGGKVVKLEFKG